MLKFIRTKAFLLIGFLVIFPACVDAWTLSNHVLIATIAYHHLNDSARSKIDEDSATILNKLSVAEKTKVNVYHQAVPFARLAILPDLWREESIANLFIRLQTPIPQFAKQHLKDLTQHWHYINTPYPLTNMCFSLDPINVVWALKNISQEISYRKSTGSILLVYLSHLIGDIHQPLHNINNTRYNCRGDAGGNGFCLKENTKGKCTRSLHSLWDTAVGYNKSAKNITQLAFDLETLYPESMFQKLLLISDYSIWSQEGYEKAEFIYNTPQFQSPSPEYFLKGQNYAKARLALAGYRLAHVLNTLYST